MHIVFFRSDIDIHVRNNITLSRRTRIKLQTKPMRFPTHSRIGQQFVAKRKFYAQSGRAFVCFATLIVDDVINSALLCSEPLNCYRLLKTGLNAMCIRLWLGLLICSFLLRLLSRRSDRQKRDFTFTYFHAHDLHAREHTHAGRCHATALRRSGSHVLITQYFA